MASPLKRILVIKTSSLGDIVNCFPAVQLLKDLYPDAEIDWLVNKNLAEIVKFHPAVSGVIEFDRKNLGSLSSFLPSFFSLRNSLRQKHYDLAFDFQGLFRNAFCGWISDSEKLIGFKEPREFISQLFYDETVHVEIGIHAVERNCLLVCKYHNTALSIPDVKIKTDTAASEHVRKILNENNVNPHEMFSLISPGARWESKMWKAEFFIETANLIGSDFPEMKFVLCGSPDDKNICAKIAESAPDRIVNLAGKTSLPEMVELIRLSSAMICCDSGPMHVAAALKVPVFAIFGPTSPELTGPYGKNNYVFQAKDGCIKCFKRYCMRSSETCHEKIKPEELRIAFRKKMGNK